MKYRRKRMVEAFQYDGDLMNSQGEYYVPEWAAKAYEEGKLFYRGPELICVTRDGEIPVAVGSYVVMENCEIYPSAKDIFERLYEPDKDNKEEE